MRKIFRKFSSKIKDSSGLMLTSDFIHDRLYHPQAGYFNKPNAQLGHLEKPIEYEELFGYEDYTRILQERYPENAWLTPSEIFKPWYGMSIANYISRCLNEYEKNDPLTRNQRVKIIEVGAGNGSAAESILDYFKAFHPLKYKRMQYNIVEISPVMVNRCRKKLSLKHSRLIRNKQVLFHNESFVDYQKFDKDLTFVVMLEVLDNMPHDRVYIVIISFFFFLNFNF